jgi:hypothetical protein
MPVVETSRTTTTQLGRGSEQVETYSSGSSTSTKGAQVVTRTEARPEVVATQAVASPEVAATASTPVHIGIAFKFTLQWHGKK